MIDLSSNDEPIVVLTEIRELLRELVAIVKLSAPGVRHWGPAAEAAAAVDPVTALFTAPAKPVGGKESKKQSYIARLERLQTAITQSAGLVGTLQVGGVTAYDCLVPGCASQIKHAERGTHFKTLGCWRHSGKGGYGGLNGHIGSKHSELAPGLRDTTER